MTCRNLPTQGFTKNRICSNDENKIKYSQVQKCFAFELEKKFVIFQRYHEVY